MKKLLFLIFVFLNFSVLNAKDLIKIGVTSGPHAQIMEHVKKIAKEKYNLEIKIIEFADYIQPNEALSSKDLDANSMQTNTFFESQMKLRNYKFIAVANTVLFPLAIYSKKIKNLDELKDKSKIGIPNEPNNSGRALLLLQSAGLIKLKDNINQEEASLLSIIENPKKLQIRELDSAQLPRLLDDLEMATINANYAVLYGLNPAKDSVFVEQVKGNPNTNIIAIRTEDKNKPWVEKLVKSYQDNSTKEFIKETFKGSLYPMF